jgi:hypothetical protein
MISRSLGLALLGLLVCTPSFAQSGDAKLKGLSSNVASLEKDLAQVVAERRVLLIQQAELQRMLDGKNPQTGVYDHDVLMKIDTVATSEHLSWKNDELATNQRDYDKTLAKLTQARKDRDDFQAKFNQGAVIAHGITDAVATSASQSSCNLPTSLHDSDLPAWVLFVQDIDRRKALTQWIRNSVREKTSDPSATATQVSAADFSKSYPTPAMDGYPLVVHSSKGDFGLVLHDSNPVIQCFQPTIRRVAAQEPSKASPPNVGAWTNTDGLAHDAF